MNRINIFCLITLSLTTLVMHAADAGQRPNIVLVVTDDQGYGDAGCYGETDVQTPVMDSVARNGVRFVNFRVNPLCAPTRVSILSGLYSLEAGMWRGPSREPSAENPRQIKDSVRLLPQYLKESGYATGIFGKWHLGYESPNLPNERGFDTFYGFLGGAHPYLPAGRATILHNGEHYPTDQHLTDLFADQALDFVRANKDRPFFCYLAFNAVHGPLAESENSKTSAKQEWLDKYETLGIELPRRDYNAILSHADHRVGEMTSLLKDLGLERNTLFIYLSDNGALIEKYPGNNGPLRGEKGSTYDGGIKVPCVMQWPGVFPAGTVSLADAAHFDIFSTILEAAGVPIPEENGGYRVTGESLVEHIQSAGKNALTDRFLFWDLYGKMAALRGDWKIVTEIENHHGKFAEAIPDIEAAQFELFNLRQDVGENSDLSGTHPEKTEELKLALLKWFRQTTR